jgi:hypothetical protein
MKGSEVREVFLPVTEEVPLEVEVVEEASPEL